MREYFALFIVSVFFLVFPLGYIKLQHQQSEFESNLKIKEIPYLKKEIKKEKREIVVINNPSPEEIVPIECQRVEPVIYSQVSFLKMLSPKERKRKFVDVLLPEILIANEEVKKERKFLLSIQNKQILSKDEKEKLNSLKEKYRTEDFKKLLNRVNTVPPSLILAQGAIESGWGTSRFFIEGNNVFGMYAFKPSSKKLKAKENNVYLKVYDNILESVRDYIYNLNVGWAYEKFREERAKRGELDELIKALTFYSTQREQYVRLLENVIKSNCFSNYDNCVLSK